jgi:hypothetical protein
MVTKLIGDFDHRPGSWVSNRLFANQPIPVRYLVDVRAGAIIKLRTVDFACQRMPLLNSTLAQHFLQSGFERHAYSLSENRGGEKAIAAGRNDRSLMTSNELIV